MEAHRAGGAALRIGLAYDDRQLAEFRERCDDLESAVDVTQLELTAHLHAILDESGAPFGVEPDKVERRAGLARGVVLASDDMLQEIAKELCRGVTSRSR